jgi:hypothetical protein
MRKRIWGGECRVYWFASTSLLNSTNLSLHVTKGISTRHVAIEYEDVERMVQWSPP